MDREITEWLNRQPKNLQGLPYYRLVWSNHQLEKRKGTFCDFTEGGLFIREVTEVREVPKYPYLQDRWVLERWVPPHYAYNPELINSHEGSYEPFYVFEDRNGNPLPLSLKAVVFLVDYHRNQGRATPLTRAAELRNEDQAAQEREIASIADSLDFSEVALALRMREAVGYTKEVKSE